jgi:hypothetical protein
LLRFAVAALLLLLVAVAYLPVIGNSWINYDDDVYVTSNAMVLRGLSADGVRWAFTTTHGGNWHPLTWLSHMLDRQLFGRAPMGPHLVNVALHGANAVLMFWFLSGPGLSRRQDSEKGMLLFGLSELPPEQRSENSSMSPSSKGDLTGVARVWGAALAVVLFALHPLRVEAVAWTAERKELLAAGFAWLAILFYADYMQRGSAARSIVYVASVLCLALGLLAKPMLVTLPVLLCVLDYWPLERGVSAARNASIAPRRRLAQWIDKLPCLLVAVASAGATLYAQSQFGNTQLLEPVSFPLRLANAAVAAVTYLRQSIWPAGLTCFYPYPQAWLSSGAGVLAAFAAAALLASITVVCLLLRARFRWLLAGWLWYLVALVPVIGIVQVGRQSHADRYTYLPAIGLSWIVAWSLVLLVRRAAAITRAIAVATAIVVVAWLALLTAQQTTYWRDDLTLWTHALAVTRDNEIANQNLGVTFLRAGRVDDAIPYLEESLRLRPGAAETHRNLGLAYEALAYREQSVRPTAEAADRFAKAEHHFATAARLRPDWPLALQSLTLFYLTVPDARFDRPREAVRLAEELVRITGGQGLIELASAYAAVGDRAAAVASLDRYRKMLLQGNPQADTRAVDKMRRHYLEGGTMRSRRFDAP